MVCRPESNKYIFWINWELFVPLATEPTRFLIEAVYLGKLLVTLNGMEWCTILRAEREWTAQHRGNRKKLVSCCHRPALTLSLSGCFSELYFPVAESGHHAPQAEQQSLLGPKPAEVWTRSCCWCGGRSVSSGWPELLILPSKISSHSLDQTGEFIVGGGVSQGKWGTHRCICECGDRQTHQLSVIYSMRQGIYGWSTLPVFSRVHWPRSRGFDNVCASRAGQWIARPHWTQIRNWDKGGSVDAKQGKFGFSPKAIIIQDGKAREGHPPPTHSADEERTHSEDSLKSQQWGFSPHKNSHTVIQWNWCNFSLVGIKFLFLPVFGHVL